jgi:glycosyltransferase involved in cell wall biosynthesis
MENNKAAETFSIVVPVYNEKENILPFYERTLKVMEGMQEPFEIIFINDGSKDATVDLLADLHRKDKRVKVIDLSRNYGKEIALSAGIDYSSGKAVIPIDVDLQDPPEIIPRLAEKWKEGYEVVYATRESRQGESWLKKLTAAMFYKVIGSFVHINIPPNTGDFRLIDRKAVDALKELRETHRFMKGLFSWIGFRQTGILYQREPRFAGNTKWNYWKLINFAIEGITSFSNIPLRLATYLGLIVSLCALLYGLFFFITTLIIGNPVPGYPSLLVIVLFIGGVQLFCMGLIGEYIGRIYDESKQRTLYFVRDKIGFNDTP